MRGAPRDVPFSLDTHTLGSGLNFTLTTDVGELDILGEVIGLGAYRQALLFSEEMAIFGIPCKVLTLEGLIKTKRAAARVKDLRLLPELEALLESQKKMRELNTAICKAIKQKAVIQFSYHGSLRIVEPQCHGISTAGNEVLRGYQTKDHGRPEELPNNKMFQVSKILDLRETGKNFLDPGPHYNPNDKSMIYVHCHL